MNRPPKVVGLVTPWVAYADELEAKLAEANARPDYSYEDTNRLEAVTAECRSHLENLNSQDAKIDRLEAQVAELTERLAQFEFVDVEYFGSDYSTEVHVYHGPAALEATK